MVSQYLSEFMLIACVHLLAVASPGPDFTVVLRQSLIYGRTTALWSSVGVGCGVLTHVLYSLLGIGLIISKSIVAFSILKWIGAGYLFFIGLKALRAKPFGKGLLDCERQNMVPSPMRAAWTGFLTNGLNPKATLFFLSLFTVVIRPETPSLVRGIYGLYMAFATALWFSGVALFFSQSKIKNAFQRLGHWLERLTGVALVGLGVKLAISSR